MSKWALYHDFDELKCETVREAIKARAITDGEVICGDIKELTADDVRGFRQFHAFCGGGFWSLALRQAGLPDDRPVWTGSCPCPSFSAAGKGRGFDDARHLWPEWFRLIRECRPATVFGEQVDAAIGPGWLDPHEARSVAAAGATRGFWADCDWWYGRDGKYRPVGPGINPLVRSAQRGILALASGSSCDVGLLHNLGDAELETAEARVGRLRLYGDAICVPVAAEFIRAYKESRGIV